jgi:hypothetical protein
MIDYSMAGLWATHVRALAIIESAEDIGRFGDGCQAANILQQHPAFFMQWYRDVRMDDTWHGAQIKAAAAFLQHYVDKLGLDLTIQAYNLGVEAVEQGKRNVDYLARWSDAFQRIRGGS